MTISTFYGYRRLATATLDCSIHANRSNSAADYKTALMHAIDAERELQRAYAAEMADIDSTIKRLQTRLDAAVDRDNTAR